MSTPTERPASALAGRYRLERELGQGGMATVHLARDLQHDRSLALKVVRRELAASVGAARFQREIAFASRVQHPHILPVLDSGEADGLLWYTMPFVAGGSLRDRLRRETQLPVAEALRIALEAARALACAHQQGVVHRDVKPENLLLTPDGSVLVADFGIARAVDESGERLTETGLAVGTPQYMSPEQAAGTSAVDARTDVYALGCVLYEMLAGEPPHTGPTAQAVIARKMTETPRSLRAVREVVSPVVEQLVSRALARVPADRFTDAGELARAIERVLPLASVSSSQETTVVPATSRAAAGARRRSALSLGIAAALLLAGGALVLRRGTTPTAAATGSVRVAVLPFESGTDTALATFAEGMSEELTSRLAHVPGLVLMARSSVRQFRASGQDPLEFARRLGVDYVVDGAVRAAPGGDGQRKIRITPEVTRVGDGTHVWGEPFAGALAGVFDLQADVAEQVARALGATLGLTDRDRVRAAPTRDVEAYRLYLLGTRSLYRSLGETREAIGYLEQAVARDSTYARAHAALAVAYSLARDFDAPTAARGSRDSLYVHARAAAERALVLDSTLSEAHTAIGRVVEAADWDWRRADVEFRTAVALDSTDAGARHWYALHLVSLGRTAEAVREARLAVALDPLNTEFANALGIALWCDRQYDSAAVAFERIVALDPKAFGVGNLSFMWVERGRFDSARALASRLAQIAPGRVADVQTVDALANPSTRDSVVRLAGKAEGNFTMHALWLAQLPGARDEAFALLDSAADRREERLILALKSIPGFDPLRADPRYRALLHRVGLPEDP